MLRKGVIAFPVHIPGVQIEREIYRKLTTCYKCCKINNHLSSECPHRNNDFKICSNCAHTSHTWKESKSKIKKCMNCGRAHSAMFNACTLRKQLMKASQIPGKGKVSPHLIK